MAWTDEPILPNTTVIKGVHIDEIRERIDILSDNPCPVHNSSALDTDLDANLNSDDNGKYDTYDPTHEQTYNNSILVAENSTQVSNENASLDVYQRSDHNPYENSSAEDSVFAQFFDNNLDGQFGYWNDSYDADVESSKNTGELYQENTDFFNNHNAPVDSSINVNWHTSDCSANNSDHQPQWYALNYYGAEIGDRNSVYRTY